MQADEIALASFPFGDVAGMKLRPVLLLTGQVGNVPEVLVAYISSIIPPDSMSSDILLDSDSERDKSPHLKTKSVLRLHKLATIHARSIVRRLGKLSPQLSAEVDEKLRLLLGL